MHCLGPGRHTAAQTEIKYRKLSWDFFQVNLIRKEFGSDDIVNKLFMLQKTAIFCAENPDNNCLINKNKTKS